MKKTIIICLQMILAWNAMSQQIDQKNSQMKMDYLEKSKANRTAGFILLAGGVALTTGGIISIGTTDWLDGDDTPFILMTAGIGSMLGSIPLFVIAGNQSHKAATFSGGIKLEKLSKEAYTGIKNTTMPAVSFKLKF